MKLTKLFVGAFALSAMLVACGDDSTSAKDTEIEELSSSSAVEIASSSSTTRNDSSSSSAMETSSSSAVEIASSSSTTRNDSSSSSVMETSSSSVMESSSSSETTKSSTSAGSIYDATAKTLKDLRDGKTYKTVTIGTQTWMAVNLNYETENSYCYDDDHCSKYGRLYTWAAAKTVCPSGWHLPSTTEWKTLFTAVGGSSTAGTVLKSTGGWYNDGNGTDAFGFSALPAGGRYYGGGYDAEGIYATFWSSTEIDSYFAYYMYLYYHYDYAFLGYDDKDYGFSVRCVKD